MRYSNKIYIKAIYKATAMVKTLNNLIPMNYSLGDFREGYFYWNPEELEKGTIRVGLDGEYIVALNKKNRHVWVKYSGNPEDYKEVPKPKKVAKTPIERAKDYDEDFKKLGQDGKMYIVKRNKNGVKRWARAPIVIDHNGRVVNP